MHSYILDSEDISELLPTAADVEFYREHGWFVTGKVLPDLLISEVLRGIEEHWSGKRDQLLPVREGYADWMPGDGAGTRNNEYVSLQNRRVRQLAWNPIIGSFAAKLAGAAGIRLFDDQIVAKAPSKENSAVGWHVDGDYWGTCTSSDMLTAWIPLHDCPEELGPLAVIDGSHKWSHEVDRSILSFHSQDMSALQQVVEAHGHKLEVKALAMKRGQMSFHHARTIHGSFPNRGDRPRMALAIHMQDDANHYRPATRSDGRPVQLFNDLICSKDESGLPNYSDPDVFPLLWSDRGR